MLNRSPSAEASCPRLASRRSYKALLYELSAHAHEIRRAGTSSRWSTDEEPATESTHQTAVHFSFRLSLLLLLLQLLELLFECRDFVGVISLQLKNVGF